MAVVFCKDKNILVIDEPMEKEVENKIKLLNQNNFFLDEYGNLLGKQLVLYMANTSYYTLHNPEPVDLTKNTLSKVLRKLQLIEQYLWKSLHTLTSEDMNRFIRDFTEGKIKGGSQHKIEPRAVREYVMEFKRFWKIYRQYVLNTTKIKPKDLLHFEWGLNLRAPRTVRVYEKFPDLGLSQVRQLAESLIKEEYTVRTLLAINLMGRKCELKNARRGDAVFYPDGRIFFQLPQIKKHSSEKVPVELYAYAKERFIEYCKNLPDDPNVLLFPSNDEAYAKHLKNMSWKLFNCKVAPKTLRKLGVAIAEELGYDRSDVERIGGWKANSDVLNHYFSRRKVSVKKDADVAIQRQAYGNLYDEHDKLKSEYHRMKQELDVVRNGFDNEAMKLELEKERKMRELTAQKFEAQQKEFAEQLKFLKEQFIKQAERELIPQ